MEIICRKCESNAFRILPGEIGTVTAECMVCGTSMSIEIPKSAARSFPAAGARRKDHRCQAGNGRRYDALRWIAVTGSPR
jgi:hypothetical protein